MALDPDSLSLSSPFPSHFYPLPLFFFCSSSVIHFYNTICFDLKIQSFLLSSSMASVLLYHVVGDLTLEKPQLSEFPETETVAASIGTIGDSSEGGIPVWRKRSLKSPIENAESRQQRFAGILNALDIVAFLAREDCLADQEKALNTPVSKVVGPDNSALTVVDPGTRLIDALEMMKQGVKRLLARS